MNPNYITKLASKFNIERLDLLEKDVLLHQILTDLSNDLFFSRNFSFKGGTCLIKHYLGYRRFSEDIDFSWNDQSRFRSRSGKSIVNDLSDLINQVGKLFEDIAIKRGLDFDCNKDDTNHIELGGGGRTCTFKVWYDSGIMKRRTYIKIQINFVEELCSKPEMGVLRSMAMIKDPELEALFVEHSEYSKPVSLPIYTLKEILSEKIRALLTRQGIKARDFVDVYLIQENGTKYSEVEECIIKKTNHALKLYEKYRKNLTTKMSLLEKNDIFDWGSERDLLLSEINEASFTRFIEDFTKYLRQLVSKFQMS